ncbi:hypothetical protein Acsp02_86470 [Actinoplanes sp. NBRC 103695]|nr:hypothetical protein Acsp02_86470 [Actinoplanes sp. NBRC 103695]
MYKRRMADAVRRVRLTRLAFAAGVFVIAWALLSGHVPWAAGIAVLITAAAVVALIGLEPVLARERALRHEITVEKSTHPETVYRLAALRGTAGDHAEQIWLLRGCALRGDREAYRLLLEVLTEHGKPDDVTALRWTCVERRIRPDDPLCTPWPGIDGPGLLATAERQRRIYPDDAGILLSLAALLDAAGRPDPAVWRALIDAREYRFHLRLARHLAGTGQLEEAIGLMRAGEAGKLPSFPDTADFLREHELLQELEEDARKVWERDRNARALAELRQLLTDQGRLDELAQLPDVPPPVSGGSAQVERWPGISAPSYDYGSSGGYTGYTGGGC